MHIIDLIVNNSSVHVSFFKNLLMLHLNAITGMCGESNRLLCGDECRTSPIIYLQYYMYIYLQYYFRLNTTLKTLLFLTQIWSSRELSSKLSLWIKIFDISLRRIWDTVGGTRMSSQWTQKNTMNCPRILKKRMKEPLSLTGNQMDIFYSVCSHPSPWLCPPSTALYFYLHRCACGNVTLSYFTSKDRHCNTTADS